jgi:hypothetical protein
MNRKRKLVKPVSLEQNLSNASLEQNLSKKNGFTNAKKQENMLTNHTTARTGLRQNEWKQSNNDRQWW